MKKLFVLFLFIGFAISAHAQIFEKNPVRFRMYRVKNKTFTIDKSDKIIGVVVDVPSTAVYNTTVSGDTLTFDGVASSPIIIKPGEHPYIFGGIDKVRIGKLTIVARDSCYITIIPARRDE